MFNVYTMLGRACVALALLGSAGAALAAPTAYRVDIDTSAAPGDGLLSFTLAGLSPSESGIALLHNFSGDFGSVYESNGGVTGDVGTHLELVNVPGDNYLSQNVTFGGKFSFDIQFDFASTDTGVLFSLASYLPGYADTVFTDDGTLLGIEMSSTGDFILSPSSFASITAIASVPFEPGMPGVPGVPPYLPGVPGFPGVPGTPGGPYQPIPAVPEPSHWLMLAAGLLLMGAMARKRQQ